MTPAPYLDTSALAKWYLNEARSEEFERYLQAQQSAAISRLTILEFRCLLARRRRTREIDARTENRVFAAFEQDLRAGFLSVQPLDDGLVPAAIEILVRLKSHALRTLDALHLAAARSLGSPAIATADRVFANAAEALGFATVRFD